MEEGSGEEGSGEEGSGEEAVVEEGSGDEEVVEERGGRRVVGRPGILRSPGSGLTRTFAAVSLADFTLLSSGVTSELNYILPSFFSSSLLPPPGAFAVSNKSPVSASFYSNLVATDFDPWATFPHIQVLLQPLQPSIHSTSFWPPSSLP